MTSWQPPGAMERKRILDRTRTIAIVGASSNPSRASNFVMTYLKSSDCDYELFPINPRETEIYGYRVYPSLADLPVAPDMVDVFRRAEDCPAVATEAVEAGARTLWLQLGVWSDEAAAIAHGAGLEVVMDRCTKIEHARFAGGLHLAGFDTGVISSKRRAARGPSQTTTPGRSRPEPENNAGPGRRDSEPLERMTDGSRIER